MRSLGRITVEEYADFVREDQQRAYRLAYGYLRSREDALDAVQEAVASGLEHLDSLRSPERLRAFFTRILVNECLDMLRRRKRRGDVASLDSQPELVPAQPDAAEERSDAMAVGRAIDALPPKLKTVVILRFFEDMTLAEVAESAGCTLSTAKARLYRALKELRRELGEED